MQFDQRNELSRQRLLDLEAQLAAATAEAESLRRLWGNDASHPATVLLLGSGGREHALARALAKSPFVGAVLVAPGNGGTVTEGGKVSNLARNSTALDISDPQVVARAANCLGASLVVVGGEAGILASGVADTLAAAGIACFGPSKAASRLGASAWSDRKSVV